MTCTKLCPRDLLAWTQRWPNVSLSEMACNTLAVASVELIHSHKACHIWRWDHCQCSNSSDTYCCLYLVGTRSWWKPFGAHIFPLCPWEAQDGCCVMIGEGLRAQTILQRGELNLSLCEAKHIMCQATKLQALHPSHVLWLCVWTYLTADIFEHPL